MAAQHCCGAAMLAAAVAIAMLRVLCYVFVHKFLFNAHIDLEPAYIVRKSTRHRFQLYILFWEILSTFHTRVEHISHVMSPIEKDRAQMPKMQKPCQKQPLPLDARGLPSNIRMPRSTPLTMPNDSSIAVHTSTQRCNKLFIGYNGTPQIHPPNCPFPSTITTKI